MTQQEIIEMVKQSGLVFLLEAGFMCHQEVKDFAKLVAEKERERISQKIAQLPFGDTAQSLSIWVKNDT
jgi:hypothetical protein